MEQLLSSVPERGKCRGRRASLSLTFIGNDRVLRSLALSSVCRRLGQSPPAQAGEQPGDDTGTLHGGQEGLGSARVF